VAHQLTGPCRRHRPIGDDQLQRRSQGYLVRDAFTDGSSEQRTRWFMTGPRSGQVASCDTFQGVQL